MLRGVAGQPQNPHKAAAFDAVPRFPLPSGTRFGFIGALHVSGWPRQALCAHNRAGPVSFDRSTARTPAGTIPAAAALGLLNLLLIGP
jgi:hypothetical protein